MNYIRFVIPTPDEDSGRRQGVIQAVNELLRKGKLSPDEETMSLEFFAWFRTHLPVPPSFSASSRSRAKPLAISWFKDTAKEQISKMRSFASLLDAHDIHVDMIMTDRPGYVVYEDDLQIVAEPFNDTRT